MYASRPSGRVSRRATTIPRGCSYCARSLARVQAAGLALSLLDQVVDGGFACSRALVHDPWFDSLRAELRFIRAHRSEAKTADAATAYTRQASSDPWGA